MVSTRRLIDLLHSADAHSQRGWLYLPADVPWTQDSPCLVLESEEVAPEQECDPQAGIPLIARKFNLMQALQFADVQSIVENARLQRPDATPNDLFDAFIYYFDHDAFIQLSES